MRNILLTIEYDGTRLFGWQRQPNRRTVQGELERSLARILGQEVRLNGVSRTDAGVHALNQKANFSTDVNIPLENLKFATNNLLAGGKQSLSGSGDIRIVDAEEKSPEFHARFDCVGKKYIYRINNSGEANTFERNYYYFVKKNLNVENMKVAARILIGTHDFAAFQSAGGTPRETTVRTIYKLEIRQEKNGKIAIEVKGDGFLYNMVRIIVGTLVDVGMGKIEAAALSDILISKDRCRAGHTAPPNGLYLAEVYYEKTEL